LPPEPAHEKQLQRLADLRDKNLISPTEYEAKRQQILEETLVRYAPGWRMSATLDVVICFWQPFLEREQRQSAEEHRWHYLETLFTAHYYILLGCCLA
jgi:hypothetical protein